jgi:hypothetical protein
MRKRCSLFLESGSRRKQPLQRLLGDAKRRPQAKRIAQRSGRQKYLANLRQRDA